MLGRGRVGAVIVLSHDCELDKKESRKRVVVAPLTAVATLPEAERAAVIAQCKHSRMVLPGVPSLGWCYADLRLTAAIDRDFIDLEKRLVSLSELG
jgi:hypothetical protein